MIVDKDDKRKSSRSYGESLLEDVRQRNDEYQKTYERKTRQAQWRGAAIKAATGIATDYMAQKAKNFIDQEAATLRKLGANTVLQQNQKTLDDMQAAKDFVGGENAYYQSELAKKYESLLINKYAGTSYSATQVSKMADLLAKQSFEGYKGFIDKDVKLTQKFVSDNIDSDTYVKNATELSKDKASLIRNLPGFKQLTGKINEDMISANDLYRTNLTALKSARAESIKQKDGLIYNAAAVFIEKQEDLQAAFGTPDTTVEVKNFTTQEMFDDYGNVVGTQTIANVVEMLSNGNVVKAYATVVSPTGDLERIAPTSQTGKSSFVTQVAKISQNETMMAEAMAWRTQPGNVSVEDSKKITNYRISYLEDSDISSQGDKAVAEWQKNQETSDVAHLFYGGKKAETDKFGIKKVGFAVSHELQLMKAKGESNVISRGVGSENIFNTLFAYQNALDKNKVPTSSRVAFNKFLESNVNAMKKEYLNLSNTERADLFKKIKASKDDGGYGSFEDSFKSFMPIFTEVADAVQNRQGQLDEQKLTAILQGLSVETGDTDSDDDETPVVTPAAPLAGTVSASLKLPATTGKRTRSAAVQYKKIIRLEKQIVELKSQDKFSATQFRSAEKAEALNTKLQKSIDDAEKQLAQQTSLYAKTYGYTLSEDELADLSPTEKEEYMTSGKIPGRHTPAV